MPKFLFLLAFVLLLNGPAFAEGQSISLFTSGQKHFAKNEYSSALADWQKAAGQGDTKAMDKLADMYANGIGVKVDYAKAMKFWHRAADKGDGDAMYEISVSYAIGRGVPLDKAASKTWFFKALDACNENAAVQGVIMKDITPEQSAEALDCLKKNADAGNYRAMMNLASKNGSGQYVLKEPLEAVTWGHIAIDTMQKKAAAGDTQAMYYMGRAFFGGVGESIPAKADEGVKWCTKAASLGDVVAMNWLENLYLTDNTYQDYKKAALWHKKLVAQYTVQAKKGDVGAMLALANIYLNPPMKTGTDAGTPIDGAQKDLGKAVAWAEKAAGLGSRDALSLLGYIYEDNNPLHNCKTAQNYYNKAAALGDRDAVDRLAARAKGTPGLVCNF